MPSKLHASKVPICLPSATVDLPIGINRRFNEVCDLIPLRALHTVTSTPASTVN